MIKIDLINQCTIEPDVDCLILPAFEDALKEASASSLLCSEDKVALELLIDKKNITGQDNFYLPSPLSPYQSVMVIGLGKQADANSVKFREAVGKAAKTFLKLKKTHLLLEMAHLSAPISAEQFLEGVILGQYSYDRFKTLADDKKPVKIAGIGVHVSADVDLTLKQAQINLVQTKCESSNWARDLANCPGNAMTPVILAAAAKEMAEETGAEYYELDEAQMAELGMNSLLCVSAGSEEEARLIVVKHTHPQATKTIAIVGKGLTFDAGGISLKGSKGMEDMKFDMCGATAVLGAMRNICIIKPQVNVICVVPSSENMPDGKAVKPGDIVKAYNGKTIEVYNTDAEGRLILADALSYTVDKYKPDLMINLATLTGACIVALGHHMAGIMSTDDDFVQALTEAGDAVHERLWRLPMNDEYKEIMKGKDADLTNIGPGYAGTVTAGAFLSHFVGDGSTKWAHMDIAGVGWNMKGASYLDEKLASGFGVRLLTRWILDEAE
jgi:leucyl aminopeptidase